jgi:hypothetical protein
MEFLARQVMSGSEIFFIFNVHGDNDKQSLEDCFSSLVEETKDIPILRDFKIYCVNCRVVCGPRRHLQQSSIATQALIVSFTCRRAMVSSRKVQPSLSSGCCNSRFQTVPTLVIRAMLICMRLVWRHCRTCTTVLTMTSNRESFWDSTNCARTWSGVSSEEGMGMSTNRFVKRRYSTADLLIQSIDSKGLLFHFASSFYQLMHTQYLVLSRLISLTMAKQARMLNQLPYSLSLSLCVSLPGD